MKYFSLIFLSLMMHYGHPYPVHVFIKNYKNRNNLKFACMPRKRTMCLRTWVSHAWYFSMNQLHFMQLLVQFKHYRHSRNIIGLKNCILKCHYLYIYIYTLLVCLSVCLFYFVSNKRPHGGTNRAIILCGPSDDPGEGLWMIKISKKWASYKIRLSLNFENPRNF